MRFTLFDFKSKKKQTIIFVAVCFIFCLNFFNIDTEKYYTFSSKSSFNNVSVGLADKTTNDKTYFAARYDKYRINLMNLPSEYFGKSICINGNFINEPSDYYSSNYFLGYFWVTGVTCENDGVNLWTQHDIFQLQVERELLSSISNDLTKSYVSNLFFGNKLNNEDKEVFVDLGVMHLFVVSGFHLQIILLVRRRMAKIKNRKIANFIDIIIILGFGFINNWAIPITRGVIGFITRRNNSYLNILITALIMLLFFPVFVFNLSFVLTFSLTTLIVISNDILRSKAKYIFPISAVVASNLILYYYIDGYEININGLLGNLTITPIVTILTISSIIFMLVNFFAVSFISDILEEFIFVIDQCLNLVVDIISQIDLNLINIELPELFATTFILIGYYIHRYLKNIF
jgi:hypothetical protein